MEEVTQLADSREDLASKLDPIIEFEKEILNSYGIGPREYEATKKMLVFKAELSDDIGNTDIEFSLGKDNLIVLPYEKDLAKQKGPQFGCLKIGEHQNPHEFIGRGNFLLAINDFKLGSNKKSTTIKEILREFDFPQNLLFVLGRPKYSSSTFFPKINVIQVPLPQSFHDLVSIFHEVGHALHQAAEPELYDNEADVKDRLKATVEQERKAWTYAIRMLRKLRDSGILRFDLNKMTKTAEFYLNYGYEEQKNIAEKKANKDIGHHFSGASRKLFKKE